MNFMHATIYTPLLKWKETELLLSIFHISAVMGKQFMCIIIPCIFLLYAKYCLGKIEKGLHSLRTLHNNKGNTHELSTHEWDLCIYQPKRINIPGYSERDNIFPFPLSSESTIQ